MDRDEFIATASPPCHECGHPVERVEIPWMFVDHGRWVPVGTMVCGRGHRVRVEPVENR
jgi:hypothetical protein